MLPSRGLRWSSQTIGIGRRRLEPFFARQFSSSNVQHGPFRPNPLISKNGASISRICTVSQLSKTNPLIRNGAGIRFASTAPIATPIASPVTTSPIESAASAASSPEPITSSLNNVSDFTSDGLLNIPESIGYLKSIGLDYGWGPTAMMEWVLEHVHIFAGTPWWASIILTTVLIRAALFKFYIDAGDNAARMSIIRPMTEPLTKEMGAARAAGDMDKLMQIRRDMQIMNKRAGIVTWKSFVAPVSQGVLGFGMWKLLRGMSNLPVPGLETGGLLWIYDLTQADGYFVLPFATALVLHWVLRKGGEMGASTMNPKMMRAMMYGFPALSFLFTFWLPASVQISFLSTGIISYFQMELFRNERFRAKFNMYPLPTGPNKPGSAAPSPYKGTIIRARPSPLTQSEINSTYTQPSGTQSPEFQAGKEALRNAQPPKDGLKKIVGGAVKDITGSIKTAREAASDIVGMGKEQMEARREKADRKANQSYEAKKQAELKKQRWELEAQKRSERRARQMLKETEGAPPP